MSGSPGLVIPWANDTLCATCREVLRRPVAVTYGEKALRISAARKCGLCRFFFDEILSSTTRLSGKPADLVLERDGSRLRVNDFNDRVYRYELHAADSQSTFSTTPFRLIKPHVNTEPCWKLIETWLHKCTSQHVICQRNSLAEKPTRLIDVETLRLVNGSDCQTDQQYAALSHCWGAVSMTMTTTRMTSEMYRQGLYLQDLPQNFQDAVFATKKLNMRYLWIDSLCIMQDDVSDWKFEAAKMGKYYRNALVILSSLSGTNSRSGFLLPRDHHSSVRFRSGLQLRRARPPWATIFGENPLSTRAWAFQERLLSTRIIHFEKNELFWECLELSAREGEFLETAGLWNGTDGSHQGVKRCLAFDNIAQLGVQPPRLTLELLMRQWYFVLEKYTALEITYSYDILHAIAGIAQKFAETTRYNYVVGIWMEDVHAGLLWNCESNQTSSYQAIASWSWAASIGPKAQIYNETSRVLESNHQATVILAGNDSTSYRLHLEACWFTARFQSSSGDLDHIGSPFLRMVLNIFNELGAFIGTGYLDNMPDGTCQDCTAIIICQRMDPTFGCVTYFLLLERIADNPSETYRRIGIGQTADTTYGYATNTLDLERLERKQIVLM